MEKKTEKLHDREFAVQILDRFFDEIGVRKENRINPNHDAGELKILAEMERNGATEAEKQLFKEKCDVDREIAISLIRAKHLNLDENNQLVYTLFDPIKDKEGLVDIRSLTFKSRIKAKDLSASLKGVSYEDVFLRAVAKIAPRCGVSKMYLEEMYEQDAEYFMLIDRLFQLAKLPIQ